MLLEARTCKFLPSPCCHLRVQNLIATESVRLSSQRATYLKVPYLYVPHSLRNLGSWRSRMWGPAGDGVSSDVITSIGVRASSAMRSQGYVHELPGCRKRIVYILLEKSPVHPLARFPTVPSPIGTRTILLDRHSSDVRHIPRLSDYASWGLIY